MRDLVRFKLLTGRLFRRPSFGELTYVDDWPESFRSGCVYLQEAQNGPWSLAFVCPCGCEEVIYLNLLPQSRPCWSMNVTWFGGVSIIPSVWRKRGCLSHFFLRDGNVVWAKD
ncbi:DUF6527 family protein [Pelagicoccus mobilis]|uniref:DUF6527 family protein n=1 Tax=Pelagicoccus mobilis TaxID=415221 RepID=UPI0035E473CA